MAASVLLTLLCALTVNAVIVGVDLDSESYRLTVVETTRKAVPVESERDEKSTCIAFTSEGRVFDSAPTTLPAPSTLCHYFPFFRSPASSFPPTPETWVSSPQGYTHLHDSISWTSEELLTMLFDHIFTSLSSKFPGKSLEFAISIPNYWTRSQRISIQLCAESTGMKVIGVVHRNSAVALNYGYTRFDNETAHFALIMSLSKDDLELSVAKFNATTKKTIKEKNVESIEMLGNWWDLSVSGRLIDQEIAEIMAKSFESKQGYSVTSSVSHMHRLTRLAQTAKTVLVKKDSFQATESDFYAGKDLNVELKYADLSQILTSHREKIVNSISMVLTQSGVTKENIDTVLLVGPDSRQTAIQDIIQDYFHPDISLSLQDHAYRVSGVALYACNATESMQIKPAWLTDYLEKDIKVAFLGGEEGFNRSLVLFPKGTRFNSKRQLTFTYDKAVRCELYEGNHEPFLAVQTSGIEEFSRKYGKKLSQVFTFVLDNRGVAGVKWAEVRTEINSTDTKNVTSESNQTDSSPTKKQVATALTLTPREMDTIKPLTTSELKAISIRLSTYRTMDHDAMVKKEAKAKLNAAIDELKEVFKDRYFRKVTTDNERNDLNNALVEAVNWMKGEEIKEVDSWTVTERTRKLQGLFKDSLDRAEELRTRPAAIHDAFMKITELNATMVNLNMTKTWVAQKDKDEVFERLREVKDWVERVEKEQAVRSLTDPPYVKVTQIQSKILGAAKNVEKIQKTPRPKQAILKEKKPKDENEPVESTEDSPVEPEKTEEPSGWQECQGEECGESDIPRTEL